MSSASMALSGTGHSYTPETLNKWLKANGGYVSGDAYVWAAINKIGLTYKGKIANSDIKKQLDAGAVLMCNVHNGGHWVLAHGYSGDNILVNDPGYNTVSYTLSEIVNGNTGMYTVNKLPSFLNNFWLFVQEQFNSLMGIEKQTQSQVSVDFTDFKQITIM